jgi:hypothetical protein
MTRERDKTALFGETRLLGVYLIAARTGPNRFNLCVTILVGLAALIFACAKNTNLTVVLDLARTSASDGLGFSSSILGFLIAGFAIFLTPTRPELFVRMQESVHPKTGYTYLKYNLSGFVVVFIHYFLFATACFIFKSFGSPHALFSMVLQEVEVNFGASIREKIKSAGIVVSFVVVETWFFYLLMLMKSFIFNLYHIVMTMVAFELDDRRRQASSEGTRLPRRRCSRRRRLNGRAKRLDD